MLRWFVFFVLSSLTVFAITIYFRLGGHKQVLIEERQVAPMILLGKEHIGAYHKINDVIVEVENWALNHNIPCSLTYGEYFDDPREKDEDRLRSIGGCVLVRSLPTELTNSLPEGFSLKSTQEGRYVIAVFEGAPSIGPFKVYPAVESYIEKNRLKQTGPVIEVYEILGNRDARTEYYFPIE